MRFVVARLPMGSPGKRYFVVDTECWVIVVEPRLPYATLRWDTFKEALVYARELNERGRT